MKKTEIDVRGIGNNVFHSSDKTEKEGQNRGV